MKNIETLIVIAVINLLIVASIAVTVKEIYNVLVTDYTIIDNPNYDYENDDS